MGSHTGPLPPPPPIQAAPAYESQYRPPPSAFSSATMQKHARDEEEGNESGGGGDAGEGPSKSNTKSRPSTVLPGSGPVKNACLSCRSKKAKCDGLQPVCSNCAKKGTTCEYVKSRRGGARKKKSQQDQLVEPLAAFLKQLESLGNYSRTQLGQSEPASALGAMFDKVSVEAEDTLDTPLDKVVRVFCGGEAILGAYYTNIYAFLPILPAPGSVPVGTILANLGPDTPYFSSISPSPSSTTRGTPSFEESRASAGAVPKNSPLLLSLLAILVLMPHPQDPKPASAGSRLLRRKASNRYACESMKLIEDFIDRAGEEGDDVPIECVQALNVLVRWEMAQNGNFQKTRQRAGHAAQVAMDLGLHRSNGHLTFAEGEEWRRDVRRRTWWLTFMALCQSSMVSGTLPTFSPYDPRMTCEFPVCLSSPEVWSDQVNILRQTTRAFELLMSVDYPDPAPGSDTATSSTTSATSPPLAGGIPRSHKHQEMLAIDRRVLAMLKDAEKVAIKEVRKNMGAEEEMARNFQLSALFMLSVSELALHRSTAFPEVAFFSKRMCGLPAIGKAPPASSLAGQSRQQPSRQTGRPSLEQARSPSSASSQTGGSSLYTQSPQTYTSPSAQSSASSVQPPSLQQQQQETSMPVGWSGEPALQTTSKEQYGGGAMAETTFSTAAEEFTLSSAPASASSTLRFKLDSNLSYDSRQQQQQPALPPTIPATYQPAAPTPAPAMIISTPASFPPPSQQSQQQPQQPAPQRQFSFDFSFDNPFSSSNGAPAPQPWWNTEQGANSLVLDLDTDILASTLPDQSFGGGFPYTNENWVSDMESIGGQLVHPQPTAYNPYEQERAEQNAYQQALRARQQQQMQQQPPPRFQSTIATAVPPPSVSQQQQLEMQPQFAPLATAASNGSGPAGLVVGYNGTLSSSIGPSSCGVPAPLPTSPPQTPPKQVPWGLGDDLKPAPPPPTNAELAPNDGTVARQSRGEENLAFVPANEGPFPAGLSLARCSAAAHSIVRLEILHRSAAFALLDGPPRALPFCACGLVAAAHAFLLLALAVQAGDSFSDDLNTDGRADQKRKKELDSLYTNVRILLAGLEKYGQMWEGIATMANEVRDALNSAISLSSQVSQRRKTVEDDTLDAEGEEEEDDGQLDDQQLACKGYGEHM